MLMKASLHFGVLRDFFFFSFICLVASGIIIVVFPADLWIFYKAVSRLVLFVNSIGGKYLLKR